MDEQQERRPRLLLFNLTETLPNRPLGVRRARNDEPESPHIVDHMRALLRVDWRADDGRHRRAVHLDDMSSTLATAWHAAMTADGSR